MQPNELHGFAIFIGLEVENIWVIKQNQLSYYYQKSANTGWILEQYQINQKITTDREPTQKTHIAGRVILFR